MSTKHDDSEEPVIRPFADFLREQAKGHSHEELSEGLHTLIARVQDTGKKGQIQYTVVVEPMKDAAGIYTVKDEIKLKLPEYDREASVFFIDDEGNFSRNDPHQLSFDSLRVLPQPDPVYDPRTGEIREDNSSS